MRGEVMRDARKDRQPGKMAAVLSPVDINQRSLENICSPFGVELANINAPTQIVISGESLGVNEVSGDLKKRGFRVIPLETSDAFHHSELMKPAVEEFDNYLINFRFSNPRVPVYLNSTGEPLTSWTEIISVLADEIVKPVDWVNVVNNMRRDGINAFREFGHGNTLTGFTQRITPAAKFANIGSIDSARQNSFQ
jgi:malonyl CoA-acyl carrier protein transacylase